MWPKVVEIQCVFASEPVALKSASGIHRIDTLMSSG